LLRLNQTLKEGDDVFKLYTEICSNPFSYIETDNSYTFTPNTDDGIQVQFIKKRFYNDLSEIFDDFDITACKISTDGVDFYASDDTYHHIDNNILHIEKFHDKSIKRFTKYVQYGFAPTKETVQGIYGIANPVFNFAGICDY
jgi:hypothetical protein